MLTPHSPQPLPASTGLMPATAIIRLIRISILMNIIRSIINMRRATNAMSTESTRSMKASGAIKTQENATITMALLYNRSE